MKSIDVQPIEHRKTAIVNIVSLPSRSNPLIHAGGQLENIKSTQKLFNNVKKSTSFFSSTLALVVSALFLLFDISDQNRVFVLGSKHFIGFDLQFPLLLAFLFASLHYQHTIII